MEGPYVFKILEDSERSIGFSHWILRALVYQNCLIKPAYGINQCDCWFSDPCQFILDKDLAVPFVRSPRKSSALPCILPSDKSYLCAEHGIAICHNQHKHKVTTFTFMYSSNQFKPNLILRLICNVCYCLIKFPVFITGSVADIICCFMYLNICI